MATTSKEGSRCVNYSLPTRRGSDDKYQCRPPLGAGNWNEQNLNPFASTNWRARLVPAAAVIPAPRVYTKAVAVKTLVVEHQHPDSNGVVAARGGPLTLWASKTQGARGGAQAGATPAGEDRTQNAACGVLLLLTEIPAGLKGSDLRGRNLPQALQVKFTLNKLECFKQAARPQRIRLAWDKQPTNRRCQRTKVFSVGPTGGGAFSERHVSPSRKNGTRNSPRFAWLSWRGMDWSGRTADGTRWMAFPVAGTAAVGRCRPQARCLHASAGVGARKNGLRQMGRGG